MYEFKHDQAAALIQPVKAELMALIEKASSARGEAVFDGNDFIDFGVNGARLVVDGDPRLGHFVADLITWFNKNSGLVAGCLDDHVRLEALIDPDLECTGVLLPQDVVEKYEGQEPPMRPVIDESIAWVAANMTLDPSEAVEG